jgi:hypothetical protein
MKRALTLVLLLSAAAACSRLNPIAPECPGCLGKPCADAGTCNSGHCVDGVCCDSACSGACDRCNLAGIEGACAAAPEGTAPLPGCNLFLCDGNSADCPSSCSSNATCASAGYCNGASCVPKCNGDNACAAGTFCNVAGECSGKLGPGQGCGRDGQCASGFCVDGICCLTACTDACARCVGAGVCGPASSTTTGRPSCSPFLCDGTASTCPATCTANSGCAAGFACRTAATTPVCATDGDRDGVADLDDCAPADVNFSRLRNCYRDADGDGVVSATATAVCSGAACPNGTTATAGTDCNDSSTVEFQQLSCVFGPDSDSDGYRAGAVSSVCGGDGGCPDGGSSLADCDDQNANAKPGQRAFFDVPRDGGSFDYDCNGSETRNPLWDCVSNYTTTAVCQGTPFSGLRGFLTAAPACGAAGVWRTCASWEDGTCSSITWWYGGCGAGCVSVDGGTSYSIEQANRLMDCR